MCWATLIAAATKDNEGAFSAPEWALLLEALPMTSKGGFRGIEPLQANPGAALGNMIRQHHALVGLAKGANADAVIAALARKLDKLDYVHAWAVITACQWKTREPEKAGVQWWTLASRQAP